MKLYSLFLLASLVRSSRGEGYSAGDNYSTLTPTDGYLPEATTDFTQKFGIAINPIISSVSLSSVSGSQVLITQIGDGQIQASTATPTSIAVVSQIGDGQIQATTATPTSITLDVVSQIGDGQIQATTLSTVTRSTSESSSFDTESASTDTGVLTTIVTHIVQDYVIVTYDGSSSTSTPSSSQSSDVTTTYTITPTDTVIATVTTPTLPTLSATTVVVDKRHADPVFIDKRDLSVSCSTNSSLSMVLENSILRDSHGRVGSIVANRQFQFDGPPPQTGAIYAAGWNIVDAKLALGNSTTFYQCLSGNFYNIYDISIGSQCTAVELDIVLLESC